MVYVLRMTPLRWASQEPPKVASVSQFAAPRDGDASFWFVCNATPPGLRGAPERGDSFAVCSPQGRRRLILICVSRHSAWSPRTPRKWRRFRSSRPPGSARPHYVLRMTPLRWASHEPTKVASVSQFAAPKRVPRLAPDRTKEPQERSSRWPRDSRLPQQCPMWAQDMPSTAPTGLQEAPRQPKRPPNRPKGLQDGPGGPQDGSKTAQKTPKATPPPSLQEAPRPPKDGWRWPGSSSMMHPRSQSSNLRPCWCDPEGFSGLRCTGIRPHMRGKEGRGSLRCTVVRP